MASFEPDDLFKELLFESVSAFGNVGLSTGITKDLNHLSKIILSILMIIGRFGPLLLQHSAFDRCKKHYIYSIFYVLPENLEIAFWPKWPPNQYPSWGVQMDAQNSI